MGTHAKSRSFRIHNNILNGTFNKKSCRTKLQDQFDIEKRNCSSINRSTFSISFNDTRRMFRNTAQRFSKTFNEIRTTMGAFSQKFRISTKRREILEEGPITPGCATPHTFSRTILGRTPTKLYSPFGIDTPVNAQ